MKTQNQFGKLTPAFDTIDEVVASTTQHLESMAKPVRQSFAERYPTIFMLLAASGASATFLGFERLLTSINILDKYPSLIMILGISILIFTGTLYKKLK